MPDDDDAASVRPPHEPSAPAVPRGRRRLTSYSPLVPVLIFVGIALAVAVPRLLLPEGSLRTAILLLAGTAVVLLAYWRFPKPALLAFALFVLFYDTFAHWLGAPVRSFDEAALPVLMIAGALRTRPWRVKWIDRFRDGAILAVVILGVAASLANGVFLVVWLPALFLMLKGIGFFYLVLWHHFDDRDIRQATLTVLAFGAAVLALGFLEAVSPPAFRYVFNLPSTIDARGQLPGVESIFVFPVIFAWFMALVAMFLFAYYVVLRRLWMLVLAALFGAGMFLSGRRRAIIGLGFALVGGLAAQFRRGTSRAALVRIWVPIGVAALVLAIVFAPGLKTLYDRTVQEWLYAPAAPAPQVPGPGGIDWVDGNPRLLLYEVSADIATSEFPLGAGLGRFGSPMSRIIFSPLYQEYGLDRIWGLTPQFAAYVTDTFWPHVLAEIGVFGVVAYAIFLIALGLSLWRATRRVTSPILHAFCLGAWMLYLHSLVESVASSMYESPPRMYLAFGAMAIALVLSRGAGQIVTTSVETPPDQLSSK